MHSGTLHGCPDWREGRRRGRRRRGGRRAEVDADPPESVLWTPEERALREAERAAQRKAELTGDALRFSVVVILLLAFVWPVGIVVLLFGGPRYLRALSSLVVEPRLRERFLRDDVDKRVRAELSAERRALESEHARSLEKLSAQVAHEIRNPITAAKSLVQQMEEDPASPENVEYARIALAELTRVERSVSHLLRFARDEEMRVGIVRLGEVVDSALETFRDRLARQGIEVTRDEHAPECALEGDAEQLRRVVINLIGNAVEALEAGAAAPRRIEIALGENLAGSAVWLRVADNGPGFDAEAAEKLWSPFYTSKESGTGLGLAITRKLVEAHGGAIEAAPRASGGAEFVVSLPKTRARTGAAGAPRAGGARRSAGWRA